MGGPDVKLAAVKTLSLLFLVVVTPETMEYQCFETQANRSSDLRGNLESISMVTSSGTWCSAFVVAMFFCNKDNHKLDRFREMLLH